MTPHPGFINLFLRRFAIPGLLIALVVPIANAQIEKRDSLEKALIHYQDGTSKVNTLIALSEWYTESDFSQALVLADSALFVAEHSGNSKNIARALTHRAELHWADGDYGIAISQNNRSLKLHLEENDEQGIAANYFAIAMVHYYKADYPEAIDYFERALKLYQKLQDRRQEAEALKRLGFVYHWMGDYPNAIPYLIEYGKVRNEFEGFVGRTSNLGVTSPYFHNEEYYKTELEMQLRAEKELDAKGDKEKLLLTLLNIADTYKELGEKEKALTYHKKAVNLSYEMGRLPNLNFLGNAYRSVGKIDSALLTHHHYLKVGTGRRNKIDMMWTRLLLAQDYYQAGQYDQALKYYYEGLAITSGMGNKLDVVINSLRTADAHAAKGELIRARELCLESISLAKRIRVNPRIKDGYLKLANFESQLGNHELAYIYMQRYRTLADSLTAGEADLQLARMQAQFELDKKLIDIQRLEQEATINEAKIENRDRMILVFVVMIALVVLLAISSLRRYRQKERANKLLAEQKHQIETLLAEIHHRVKNNLQVISSLLSIQSDQLKNKNARMAVLEGQSRVQAMGLIHESIYKAENFAYINIDEYLRKLSGVLVGAFGMSHVQIEVKTDHHSVDVDTAVPLGLIVNELITNSLKHAFTNIDKPKISIDLHLDQEKTLMLKVADNGKGFMTSSGKESFGLTLVKELAAQLGGSIEFVQDNGFCVLIRFKKFKLAA